ncbi:MAG: lipid-A-disaccharide synthase [Candidatus Hydrogenedens sp.]|nr:lipid-A-disaccharide synthase [Candidatus Hydrogenedens sp.]
MKTVFLIAGESSGDLHGANLIRALKAQDPEVTCFGLGGRTMETAGMELVQDLASDAIMGFAEVLRRLLPLRRLLLDTVALIRERRPDVIVLIDYPGFNIRFAEAVAELGIPIVYYISPQVWAWKKKRIHKIARLVRKMLVIFPFEEELYRDKGVYCRYVGHPLLDELKDLQKTGDEEDETIIGMLPGSRSQEIQRIAPVMAQVCRDILARKAEIRFMTACTNEARAREVRAAFEGLPVEVKVRPSREVFLKSRCCLIASGTATLEAALLETPFLIVYKVNRISYWLARLLVRIPYIGIVNILTGSDIVPEYIQHEANSDKITPVLLELLEDSPLRNQMMANFRMLQTHLGGPGASDCAAEEILALLRQ